MFNLLSRSFNVAVLQACNRVLPLGFDVSDKAPESLESLLSHYQNHGRVLVWSGASEHTIFGDREVNYAFRAWHDSRHIVGNHDFTFEGESAVCDMQVQDLLAIYGKCDAFYKFERLLIAEVIGQALFFEARGAFPENQIAFTSAYLKNPSIALCGDYDLPALACAQR